MKKDVATIEQPAPPAQVPATQAETVQMLDLIKLAASDERVDPAKLHSLLDAQERVLDRKAEQEFNAAYMAMVQEIPRFVKTKGVSYKKDEEAFKYARYEDIEKVVKPILRKHAFSVTFTSNEREGGGAVVFGELLHIGGHKKTASIGLPLDTSGGKNNIQGMGSTISYGRRYLLCMLLDIVTIGEDDDGNMGKGEPISAEHALALEERIKKCGASREEFMKFFMVEDMRDLTPRELKRANQMLAKREKANADS